MNTVLNPAASGAQGLRTLDLAFGRWVVATFAADAPAEQRELLQRLACAVSFALHLKHSCLDLTKAGLLGEAQLEQLLHGVTAEQVQALPREMVAVQSADRQPPAAPLVRSGDGRRLWLQKYYLFERAVAQQVRSLAAAPCAGLSAAQEAQLELFFPRADRARNAGQFEATRIALTHRFAVITGGPGTGKTWTVARIIALLQLAEPGLRIELAAPTGKAANRMMESLRAAMAQDQNLRLPAKGHTLHSLLGVRRHTPKPLRNRDKPLELDVLIVDEASMVDLPMMARVLDALPAGARLVLLGDKDQLHSVEAGGVLAELCAAGADSIYRSEQAPVGFLTHNYRSTAQVQALAEAVNAGRFIEPGADGAVAVQLLKPGDNADQPGWLQAALDWHRQLAANIAPGSTPEALLAEQAGFQLLCALRNGPAGVAPINLRLENALGERYRRTSGREVRQAGRAWFPGLPVMILRNDHQRGLYNGDIGLVLPVVDRGDGRIELNVESGQWRACFPGTGDGGAPLIKAISLAQMPPFESCFALTVHKSQGSEYGKVVLVLPDDAAAVRHSPLITRELLYTGITRAKRSLEIWCGEGVLEMAATRRTVRMSGLAGH